MPTKKPANDGGVAQMQAAADERNARGYDGVVPDPTPNFNYTVAGNDAPTPETDAGMKKALDERTAKIEADFADVIPQGANPAAAAPSEPAEEPEPEAAQND